MQHDAVPPSTQTPLIIAAKYGNEDIVKLLVEAGANVNAAEDRGNSGGDQALLCCRLTGSLCDAAATRCCCRSRPCCQAAYRHACPHRGFSNRSGKIGRLAAAPLPKPSF